MTNEDLLDEISKINNELINSKRELYRLNGSLEQALCDNKNLLKELQHRAKNSFAIISGMVHLAKQKINSKEVETVLDDLDARILSVSDLYNLLYSSGSFEKVNLASYCAKIATSMISLTENLSIETNLEDAEVPIDTAASIGLILTELITNSIKYAFPKGQKGKVSIVLKNIDYVIYLEVSDTGIGFPLKVVNGESSGMGHKLIRSLCDQIDASFCKLETTQGTSFRLTLGSAKDK